MEVVPKGRAADVQREALPCIRSGLCDAQAASTLQQEVLAGVCHDLKGPVTAIRCTAQVAERKLSNRLHNNDSLRGDMLRIQQAATQMCAYIDELMDVARLQGGQQLLLRKQRTDLLTILSDAAQEAQFHRPRREVRMEIATTAIVGDWDEPRLQQPAIKRHQIQRR